jgi:hypothetical protein
MLRMFRRPTIIRRYAADISRISSVIEYPRARRADWSSRMPGIIALTFTA